MSKTDEKWVVLVNGVPMFKWLGPVSRTTALETASAWNRTTIGHRNVASIARHVEPVHVHEWSGPYVRLDGEPTRRSCVKEGCLVYQIAEWKDAK